MHDLLIHDIDFCLWTFGVPQAVSATGYGSLAEGVDTITANLHYEHIPSVVIAGGWHTGRDYPFSMGYTVVSEAGTYEFDSQRSSEVMFHPVSGKTHVESPESVDGYALELSYFADCCLNEQQPDFCPPEDSARAVQLAVLLLEARSRKGEKIPCQI
ncbi:MAG TPA: Gfo/Idh/MocA family oxidoreductase [Bryobacteraceae bacterium]|nr:Gfo/Idh/MocA family oxidoreductase [Bryobacteraceae bacterium]